ncbi:hypothetical protein [Haloarcula sp. H-GB5]
MSDTDFETKNDADTYEEKRDELNDGLLTAYAAGFRQAVETFDIDADFDTSVSELKQNDAISEAHYYFWDGRKKPLQFWLRDLLYYNRIDVDDLSLETSDEGPVLCIGDSVEVTLQTFVETTDVALDFESMSDTYRTETDSDGETNWWTVRPYDSANRPGALIQPVVDDEREDSQ